MDTDERRLDGNAAAGLLGEIFPFDMTSVWTVCAGCGSMDHAGAQPVYMDAPGMIMRCIHCDNVLIRVAKSDDRCWLDLRGVVCLQIDGIS